MFATIFLSASTNLTGCIKSSAVTEADHKNYYEMLERVVNERGEGKIQDGIRLAPGIIY